MADVALRRFQIALEGPFTAGAGPLNAVQQSIYNATTNVGSNGAIGTSGAPPYPATRRLSIEKGVGADWEYVWEAPVEARGTYAGRYQTILHQIMAKGKIPAFVYADDLTWLGKMVFSGSPTVSCLPNAPLSLLTAGAIPTTAGTVSGSVSLAAPAAPVPTNIGTTGTVLAGTYQVQVTYVTSTGESLPSASGSTTTSGTTSVITVPSPTTVAGAIGWYAYVTQAGGSTFTRQQTAGSPTALGSNLTISNPPTSSGLNPPVANTSQMTQPTVAALLALTMTYGTTSATAQTFTVTGTVNGIANFTETVNFAVGSQTVFYNPTNASVGGVTTSSWTGTPGSQVTALLFTKNYFSAVTSIVSTAAAPASSTLAVSAVYGFQWVYPLDMSTSTLYSATAEYFDGTSTWQLPGLVAEKFTLTAGIGKTLKSDVSFSAKNKVALQAYVASPNGTSGVGITAGSISTTATQGTQQTLGLLSDNILPAIPTYLTRVYTANLGIDPTVYANVTQINARLTDYKYDLDNKLKLGKAADGTPNPNFVGRDFYGEALSAEMTMLFNNGAVGALDPGELTQFQNQQSRTVRVAFPGVALPCGALAATNNWPYALTSNGTASGNGGYYGVVFDIAGKYEKVVEKDVDGRMALSFSVKAETDITAMNAPSVVTLVNRIAPQFAF